MSLLLLLPFATPFNDGYNWQLKAARRPRKMYRCHHLCLGQIAKQKEHAI